MTTNMFRKYEKVTIFITNIVGDAMWNNQCGEL